MKSLEEEIRSIVESGKDIDYGYDGENEYAYETYNTESVVQNLLEFIQKLTTPTDKLADNTADS